MGEAKLQEAGPCLQLPAQLVPATQVLGTPHTRPSSNLQAWLTAQWGYKQQDAMSSRKSSWLATSSLTL